MPKSSKWIIRLVVSGQGVEAHYRTNVAPILTRFGAMVLSCGPGTDIRSVGSPALTAVIAFPDYATAQACWDALESAELLENGAENAINTFVMFEASDASP
jgi:uncharacterized protein (DUF1330 family)